MKEHKKNLKNLSKKQLIDQVLLLTEYNAQSSASHDMEVAGLERQRDNLEQYLRSAENALDYKEKVIEKYKTLLSFSIEDL
jgi:cell fate regulator YaaT (PSP1 superfamily)